MTEKKFVKRDFFNVVLENAESLVMPSGMTAADVIAFAENELNLLAKKNAKSKSKGNPANEALAQAVLEEFEVNRLYTVSETMKEFTPFIEYEQNTGKVLTNQKATSILHALLDNGKIERVTEKGKALFRKVGE